MQERNKDRTIFNSTLDRLVSESNGQIPDRQELFNDFARAHFTGNYMPLARKIDSVFGVGAFRKLATELGEIKE